MKQLEIDDRTFDRAERQARAVHLSLAEYVSSLIEHEKLAPRIAGNSPSAANPIGLFADRADIIDEMMIDVIRTRRLPLRAGDE